ncbi:hypothetical protein [Pedobacter sp. ASV12]|uniref:hypothetical protein n=1 Tax=Pedobacter sp. ASV12 TaxID=2795120 RepID=UPI0018EC96EB|nr:hypothetical protein [Pedobacter sp. ASV12]
MKRTKTVGAKPGQGKALTRSEMKNILAGTVPGGEVVCFTAETCTLYIEELRKNYQGQCSNGSGTLDCGCAVIVNGTTYRTNTGHTMCRGII